MKNHREIIKTIAITILVTANLAFIAGMQYNQNQTDKMNAEVQAHVESLKAELFNEEN